MARVEQARKNIKYSTIAYILKITLQFVVRLVFVKSLPIEYLGINGLLSNFLSMLSLAELGVGPAIIYSLYQPLAKKDTATIKALIALFKKAYTVLLVCLLLVLVSACCHGWTGLLKAILLQTYTGFILYFYSIQVSVIFIHINEIY